MAKKILDSKLLYALLAIVIAIGLWVYVIVVDNPEDKTTLTGIPVTFLNEDVLEENGLMISNGRDQTVTLTVSGSKSALANLEQAKDSITVTVDVGRITTPGEQRMGYDYNLPSSLFSNLQVTKKYPENIDFTVSRYIKKEIKVKGEFKGDLAEGYLLDGFTILPGTIEIYGIESEVNQVEYALVTVGGENVNATVEGDMGFTLIGFQGEELKDLDVQCSTETVSVIMPVLQTADVPLAVKLIPGGGVTSENISENQYVKYKIEPESITVSGAEEDLEPLNEILLGEIDLSDVIGSGTFEFDIPLDPVLENISGVTKATVTVTVSGLETKVLEADRIELIPEGVNAAAVTQSLRVMVRGTAEAIELISDHNLRVVADLSEFDGYSGRCTVPVKVYLDSTSDVVGVVGSDYKIVVDIS